MEVNDDIRRKSYIYNLTVNVFTGNTLIFKVKKSDPVSLLQEKIEVIEKIPIEKQLLIFMGRKIDNKKSFKANLIEDDSAIFCSCSNIQIIIPRQGAVPINIRVGETIGQLKQKIQSITSIPQESQRLFYSCCSFNGQQLEDSFIITDNHIAENIFYLMQALEGFHLFVEVLSDARILISVSAAVSDTILTFKHKILQKLGQTGDKCLLFQFHNKLKDDRTIADYKIKNGSTLQMCKDKLIYFEMLDKGVFSINVKRTDYIDQVLDNIRKTHNIQIHNICVYFQQKKLDTQKTLSQYNIGYGMKIELRKTHRVYIRSPFKPSIAIEFRSKVNEIKEFIENKFGIPVSSQKILCNGKEIGPRGSFCNSESHEYPIFDLKLYNEGKFLIFVNFNNTRHELKVRSLTDTIENVKSLMQEFLGDPLSKTHFYYKNEILDEDEITLKHYNIRDLDFLDLYYSDQILFQIYIKTLTGKMFPVLVTKEDIILIVKEKIRMIDGPPVDDQRIIVKGQGELEDQKTIADYNIQKNSIVYLVLLNKRLKSLNF